MCNVGYLMMSHTIGGTKTNVFDLSRGLVDTSAFEFLSCIYCHHQLTMTKKYNTQQRKCSNTNSYVDVTARHTS